VIQAIVSSGAKPVFVDIDPNDFNAAVGSLQTALSNATRAVIATHMFGYPTDVAAVRSVIGGHPITLIEDCAQYLPLPPSSAPKARGDLRLFSFGPTKPLSTVSGGMIVTGSSDLWERIKRYRDHNMDAWSPTSWAKHWARFLVTYVLFHERTYGLWYKHRTRLLASGQAGSGSAPVAVPDDYQGAYAGFQARIGLIQLHKAERILARRRRIAATYDQHLRDLTAIRTPPIVEGATYTHYTVRVPPDDRADFRQHLAQAGVATDQAYDYALPCLDAYRPFADSTFPHSAQASREVVNLPCYPDLTEPQIDRVIESIQSWTGQR